MVSSSILQAWFGNYGFRRGGYKVNGLQIQCRSRVRSAWASNVPASKDFINPSFYGRNAPHTLASYSSELLWSRFLLEMSSRLPCLGGLLSIDEEIFRRLDLGASSSDDVLLCCRYLGAYRSTEGSRRFVGIDRLRDRLLLLRLVVLLRDRMLLWVPFRTSARASLISSSEAEVFFRNLSRLLVRSFLSLRGSDGDLDLVEYRRVSRRLGDCERDLCEGVIDLWR